MGCLKATDHYQEPSPFLGICKQEGLEKSTVHFLKIPGKKSVSPKICSNYYPFGLQISSLSWQREDAIPNRYLYNTFELQDDLNFGLYDYLARYYDPAIGRFINVDPAADFMSRYSPYAYAFDNPIRFTDPDGMIPDNFTGSATGNWTGAYDKRWWEEKDEGEDTSTGDSSSSNENQSTEEGEGSLVNIDKGEDDELSDSDGAEQEGSNSQTVTSSSGSNLIPVAVMWGVDMDFVIGYGTELTVGAAIIFRGPDAGEVYPFLDGSYQAIGEDISASFEGLWIFYTGNSSNFNATSLEGIRTEISAAITRGIDIGTQVFFGQLDIHGGRVIGIGGSIGVGYPVFGLPASININRGETVVYK